MGSQQTLHNSISTYTPAHHRAIIMMRCAMSRRPFNMIKDPFYLQEVQLLYPSTQLPSTSTVSHCVVGKVLGTNP
ncbi:hypothetical protein FIBSPDRAFT_759663 [Athelia psychrophila]|uniref:Uncharacterized protein n=1 Tax=Athelia psychrophila TaxID=1759441 RepID=A0A165YKD2_9AGAM|nr:hypothetical protein FIBSPDRAFT_759663 [Fibularhizoctonia sp. CBS 109695]